MSAHVTRRRMVATLAAGLALTAITGVPAEATPGLLVPEPLPTMRPTLPVVRLDHTCADGFAFRITPLRQNVPAGTRWTVNLTGLPGSSVDVRATDQLEVHVVDSHTAVVTAVRPIAVRSSAVLPVALELAPRIPERTYPEWVGLYGLGPSAGERHVVAADVAARACLPTRSLATG